MGSKFEIAFSMKTLSPNGLLLWIGQREMSSTSDFVALSLQNGFAHLRFNLGSGELILRDNSTRLDDGQWHSVKALRFKEGHLFFVLPNMIAVSKDVNCGCNIVSYRVEQKATLIIDDQPPVSGIAPGSLTQVNTDTGLYLGTSKIIYLR